MTKQDVRLSGRELTQLFQSEQANLQQLEQQRNDAIARIGDVEAAKAALNSIQENSKDTKIVVPLGSGIFADAAITDTKNVRINLPGGVVVSQDVKSALERLKQRKEQLKKDLDQFEQERKRVAANLNEMAKIIQQGREYAISELEKKVGESKPTDGN